MLVTGGYSPAVLNSAEIYDPSTGVWRITGNMNYTRYDHITSILANGKVLVTGGYNGVMLNSAEVYDPSTGLWTITANMSYARYVHTASILTNGEVLVTGGIGSSGYYLNSSERYQP